MSAPTNAPPSPRHQRIMALVLAAITFLLFSPVRHHQFNYFDDFPYVLENPVVLQGFTWDGVKAAFTQAHFHVWHPLTTLTHMLDVELFGVNAGAHLLVNVLLHSLSAALLFLLLVRMTREFWLSAIVAALFAWHPLRVESVAWVSERKDVLSTLFWLLTTLAYVRYTERPGRRRYLIFLCTFAVACLTKPMLVTLPFALLLLDVWPLSRLSPAAAFNAPGMAARFDALRGSLAPLLREKIPLFIMIFFLAVATYHFQDAGDAVKEFPLASRVQNATVAYAAYLGKTLWPESLAVLYPRRDTLPLIEVLFACALLLAITATCLRFLRARPFLAVGWFWYLGTLVPVIGFIQVGEQAMADRYTYVPGIGLFIMLVWGARELVNRTPAMRWAGRAAAALAMVACLVLTSRQLRLWRDPLDLFTHTARVTRDNATAYFVLGSISYDRGDFLRAFEHVQTGLRIRPWEQRAHIQMGNTLVAIQRREEALRHYTEAVRLRPDFAGGRFGLAFCLQQLGRYEEAVAQYREGLRTDPGNLQVHLNLGTLLSGLDKPAEALPHCQRAVELEPANADAHFRLAVALADLRRAREAIRHYGLAIRLQPDSALALNGLAWLLATHPDPQLRNGPEAVRLALRACELHGRQYAVPWDTLAAAYAEGGRFQEAIEAAGRAIDMVNAAGQPAQAAEILQRLELYRSGRPFRDRQ
ncbi:MAG: tetratricopeptide repeat protein [Verrucomicrobiota bacterium]